MPSRPRVLFFGMPCRFSIGPLSALLGADLTIAGVVIPAAQPTPGAPRVLPQPHLRALPMAGEQGILDMAWSRAVPVIEVGRLTDPSTVEALQQLAPDLIAIACFPRRLPPTVLAIPTLGSLNVHPSLLPAGRGPAPLFWTFRNGDTETGVTIHLVDEGLDTGAILLQERVAVPEGIWGADLERQCSSIGGRLLVGAIEALSRGDYSSQLQSERDATYFPLPGPDDLTVRFDLPARRVYGFVRGAAGLGYPLTARIDGVERRVLDALGYRQEGHSGGVASRAASVIPADVERIEIVCAPGTVELLLAR